MVQKQEKINIAILQMGSVLGNIDANIDKVNTLIEQNGLIGVDVLVLPEVWSVGWACSLFKQTAQSIEDSSILSFLSKIARTYNVNIIGGSIITEENGEYFNTCPVFDRLGNLVAKYSKTHLYSYYGCDEGTYITKGGSPVMVNLDGINYGLTICYDIRFPEIYREYAKAGADVLVNCAAWGATKPIQWEMMTKSRAIENQCYMVALTQSGCIKNDEFNLGQSRIIDYNGNELATIMEGEGIAKATIDVDLLYRIREKSPTITDIRDNYEVKILCEK